MHQITTTDRGTSRSRNVHQSAVNRSVSWSGCKAGLLVATTIESSVFGSISAMLT